MMRMDDGGDRMDGSSTPAVYIVSDAAGDTGEMVVKAAAAQFHPRTVECRRFSFVENEADIDRVIESAAEVKAMIAYTLVLPRLKQYLAMQSRKRNLQSVDLLGPVLNGLEMLMGMESQHIPGVIHQMDEDYFKKVEAVEFAVKYDDGRDTSGIRKADIVLVGVSRTSKTPLSMYLAHKKYKVANVPLVPELKPPDELFAVPNKKIIGLRIDPDKLNVIRRERLKSLGLGANATYANQTRIEQELAFSQELMSRLGCIVIDVSNKAVEEIAGTILEYFHA